MKAHALVAAAITIGLLAVPSVARAEDETEGPAFVSPQEALQIVRERFRKLCQGKTFDCPIATQRNAQCPFLYMVVVRLPESEGGPPSLAIWISLDKRGRVIAMTESREGACGSA